MNMKTKFFIVLASFILSSMNSLHAQWNDSGNYLTTTDSVGIGTTTPRTILDVIGTTTFTPTTGQPTLTLYRNQGIPSIKGSSTSDGRNVVIDPGANNYGVFLSYTTVGGNVFLSAGQAEAGKVGIGTTSPQAKLDVLGQSIVIGSDNGASTTRTTSTIKTGFLLSPHYTNTEEPLQMMYGYSGVTENYINIGGGSSSYNATNKIKFFTTNANNYTTGGTERMVINGSGYVGIGTITPNSLLSVGTAHGVKLSNGNSSWANNNIIVTGNDSVGGDYVEIRVPGSTANNTFLRINQNGNIGVNTATIESMLNVNGSVHLPAAGSVWIGGYNDQGKRLRITGGYNDAFIDFQPELHFRSGLNEVVLFDSLGNVGIGTATPSYKLDVNGEIHGGLFSTPLNTGMFGYDLSQIADEEDEHFGYNSLGWYNDGTGSFNTIQQGRPVLVQSSLGGMKFYTGGSMHFAIKDNGRIGIGTIDPNSDLTIYKGTSSTFNTMDINVASSGTLTQKQASYFLKISNTNDTLDIFKIRGDGNIGIGTNSPDYKLDVRGILRAQEIVVNLNEGADFVFNDSYKLKPIQEVYEFVKENKHLPDIPSATEMVKDGVNMGEFQLKLLQKVEELTLYMAEQDKVIKEQQAKINELENLIRK